MKTYPCGTTVSIREAGVVGQINAVCIRYESVLYEVAYFLGGEYKVYWLHESEFETTTIKKGIGFK